MTTMTARRPSVDREVQRRLRRLWRTIGNDIQRTRIDIAASQAAVASEAGMDRSHLTRIEAGLAHPSLESLVAIALAMGADLSIRIYAGRGPLLTDRHSARMIEATIRQLAPVWRPHLEVHVTRPVRGYIDAVLERRDQRLFVVAEFESVLPRLEQQIRPGSGEGGRHRVVGPGRPGTTSEDLAPARAAVDRANEILGAHVRVGASNGIPGADS